MYETFAHTADLGLRVRAGDLDELFADAAAGLFSLVVNDVPSDLDATECRFEIEGSRLDLLLLDWLNELLYVFDSERMVLGSFEVEVGSAGLRATARAQPLDPDRHGLLREVKAITYHGLKVEQDGEQWLAEVIVDI
jgi:SHS2 domain-containing protein